MKAKSVRRSRTFFALGVGAALSAFGSAEASGQEKCKISWEVPAADATFTGQHAFDVGDVPGHQVRIFEVRRTIADEPAELRGAEAGRAMVARLLGLRRAQRPGLGLHGDAARERRQDLRGVLSAIQTTVNPDGSQKTEATTVHKWTGGTGKYQGVRGIQRESTVFDPDTNFNETRAEAEYWFEK